MVTSLLPPSLVTRAYGCTCLITRRLRLSHGVYCYQLWELCRHCKLFDRRVTVAEVNLMLQQLRARHTDAVFQSFVARTKFG